MQEMELVLAVSEATERVLPHLPDYDTAHPLVCAAFLALQVSAIKSRCEKAVNITPEQYDLVRHMLDVVPDEAVDLGGRHIASEACAALREWGG